ncbi:unnamed protein product [Paramecium pentaurelia]|uniref:Uncharacterized protein n=1 Tax=Paramecium pentaurelia TaxID=43138 RepID=A0A8S1T196_9CILI|nr:unnamed protein product [Paramecium pentaurelia]
MSEIEELTKQKQVLQSQQAILENWIILKKNLQQKFKNPSEAFKGLVKENAQELQIQDFADYAKGLNLNEIFKDSHLNEETFTKIWEQWEFNYKANQHKLQMIDEKLEVLTILEDKDAKMFKGDPQKKKLIVSQIQGCENLEDLYKKLGEMVQNSTDQKQKDEVVPNESDIFSQFLAKKSQIQFNELSISKMQTKLAEIPQQSDQSDSAQKQKLEQPLVESQIIVIGKVTLPKKSYLDSQHSIIHKRGNYSTNQQSKTFIYDSTNIKILSPKLTRPKEQFRSPKNFQQPSNFDENDQIRRSQKTKRLKGDLQNYIGEIFHYDNHQKNPYEVQQKGLQGFNCKKSLKTVQHRIDLRPTESIESQNIQKRVQNIRNKLDEYSNKRIRRYSPQKPYTSGMLIKNDTTPERRYSQRRSSPYTPGNVHRLNVDRLKQEKETVQQQNSDKKPFVKEEDEVPQKGLDRQKAFISD